jgi:hypothetical protein
MRYGRVREKETKGNPVGVAKVMTQFSRKFKPDVSRNLWLSIQK